MKYNVFTDFHHASLLQSFILLFEKRLGGNVYRPIGMEWAEKGFWKVYDHPATQQQFLAIGGATPDGTPRLNEVAFDVQRIQDPEPIIYYCQDIDSGQYNKAITFEGFMETKFDIVIASLPQHIEPFKRLCELHPNKPKLIYQIGNQWDVVGNSGIRNVMASAKIDSVPSDINFVQYHQEFDLDTFYPYLSVFIPEKNICSFVNVFQSFPDWPLFLEVERLLGDWSFRSYGGQCRDGAAHGSEDLATGMRASRFIWHTKAGGDGYGHVLYNSAAVGRPIIYKKSYYEGKMGEELMIDGITGINIDGLSPHEIALKIQYYSQPDLYTKMCQAVRQNFKNCVDFDAEAEKIKVFLANLI